MQQSRMQKTVQTDNHGHRDAHQGWIRSKQRNHSVVKKSEKD